MKNKPFGEAPLLRLVICLMAGIVVGDSVGTVSWLWPALIVLVVGTLLLWRYAVLQSVGIAMCFVLLGWLLIQRQETTLRVSWPEEEVIYEAVVLTTPVEKPKTIAVNIYEYSDTEKHSSVIKDCQCVFILFDMTKREAFERLLDNWIIFVRDTSGYKGKIIILGNYSDEKDFLTTDEDEVKELIDVCDINGEFHRIGTKSNEEKKELIKGFINAACSQYVQGKKNQDDCFIF